MGRQSSRRAGSLRWLSLFIALSVMLAACGGSESQPTPPAPQPTATTASASVATPTAVAQTASSPTSAPAAPTVVVSKPITVDALWFGIDGGTPLGGVSTVKV